MSAVRYRARLAALTHRVHVGDPTTITATVFTAWQKDRDQGLDALMLAPTRDQVADLNSRARADRLHGSTPTHEVELADGIRASVGDTVITRANDRRLRTAGGDWVKNGDRWTVQNVTQAEGLHVKHVRTGRTATLPAGYVSDSVELGYATTIHAAQGVTADTMHGVITGDASRQQLYTMLTRGRTANHVYLPVVSDGDPHTAIHPDTTHPKTATDLLGQVLARDDTPPSASTLKRLQSDPAQRLGDAVDRYLDALHVAAEHATGPDTLTALDQTAERVATGLTQDPAWPTLRAHLLVRAADGANPHAALTSTAATRDIDSATDRAAVINSRLRTSSLSVDGPLPWLPRVPASLATDPSWGTYLTARANLIGDLAEQVRTDSLDGSPAWLAAAQSPPPAPLIADVQVWRAATRVQPGDIRPTGPAAVESTSGAWQEHLDHSLAAGTTDDRWSQLRLITELAPGTTVDSYTPVIAARLARLSAAGVDMRPLLQSAAADGPLPDDQPAAALWWRIVDHLPRPREDTAQVATAGDIRDAQRAQRAAQQGSASAPAPNREHGTTREVEPALSRPEQPLLSTALRRARLASGGSLLRCDTSRATRRTTTEKVRIR